MKEGRLFLAIAIVLSIVLASTFGLAANEVIDFKVDKNAYSPGETITLGGMLYDDTGTVSEGNLSITLNDAETTLLTSSAGSFSTTLTAPVAIGDYTLTLTYGTTSVETTLTVSDVSSVELALISTASESYEVIDFVSNKSSVGITSSGSITGTLRYGNFTNTNANYFAIIQKDEVFDTLYISQAADFSTILYQDIGEDSKIKLGGNDYRLFYVDPAGGRAIFIREIEPLFYGTGAEWTNLFILALNSTGSSLDNLTSLNLEGINGLGQRESLTISSLNNLGESQNTTNATHALSIRQGTNYGYKAQQLLIGTTGGNHELIVGGLSHISYFVKTFSLNIGVESLTGSLISTAQKGQTVVLKASVVDLNNGTSTSAATVTAKLIAPDGTETDFELVPNSVNIFSANTTLSSELVGEYGAFFTAEYAGASIKKQYRFNVKSDELFMKAFSAGKGEGDGFPPNSQGILIVGGRDLATNTLLNLTTLTSNCNRTRIYLSSILDDKKTNYLSTFSVLTLTAMLDEFNAPTWIRNDMQDTFGTKACAIRFTTPSASGTYKLNVEANLSGTVLAVKDYLDVTTLFVYGMPAHCTTGSWSDRVAPGGTVCIRASVYDASTGRQVARANITELSLIEVFSMSNGIITDQVSNIAEVNFTNGEKGLSFKTSNSSLGDHSVRFRVKAINNNSETVRGIGNGWYRTELWSVWAFPYCTNNMFCNFGSRSNVSLRVEAFSAGFGSGQSGITVSLSSIKNFDTGETVSINTSGTTSCTTASDNSSLTQNSSNSMGGGVVLPAYCYLTILPPAAGWGSGGHELKLTATDTNYNNLSFYSWFRVESFRFFAWNRNWEISTSQDAEFDVTLEEFDGTPITADVTVSKLYYMGGGGGNTGGGKWMQPVEIELEAGTQTIPGRGTYRINSSLLSGLKSGFYDLVFNAVSGSGTQTARAGFNIRSFVAVTNPVNNNWDRRYAIGDDLVINVSAFNSINWSTYPPTGTPHAISSITPTRITKMGMWDSPYKNSDELVAISDDSDCDTNGINGGCLLTIHLTGFDQSQYDLELEIEDDGGNTITTMYNFRTETFTITVPEIQDFRIIPASNKMADKMDLTLSTDKSCGTSSDTVEEPENVTNCLFDEDRRLPTIYYGGQYDNTLNLKTVFLLDKTNSSAPRLFVNSYNDSIGGNMGNSQRAHNNFSLATPILENEIFTDTNGYSWNLTSIDAGIGKITLKSVDGVIRTRTQQASGSGNTETTVEYLYQYIVDKSLSQSGFFLYSGNGDWEDKFWDEEWAQVDLDADGHYNCNNENGTQVCEEYLMLLADRQASGVYDTLLLSTTRNMTQGRNSYDGFTGGGAGDLKLNDNANAIYLLNLIYSESNGVGQYKLVTTTNKAGWPGRNLGVFQVGSQNIRVPVMIASPSTKQGIAGENVTIRKLRTFGTMNFVEYSLANQARGTTGSNGITILTLNVSGIASGEYMIMVEVNKSSGGTDNYITTSNDWDNPKIDLRSFSISSIMGMKKRITSMVEWSESAGNLFKEMSSEANLGSRELRLQCNDGNNALHLTSICHVDDWMFRELWLNLSDSTIFKTNSLYGSWYLNVEDIGTGRWNLSNTITLQNEFGGQMTYIFENFSATPLQFSLEVEGTPYEMSDPGSSCRLTFLLNSVNTTEGTIEWDVSQTCPWSSSPWYIEQSWTHYLTEPRFVWGGLLNISTISDTGAIFNVFKNTLTLSSPVESLGEELEDANDQRVRVVSSALDTDYSIYVFNSIGRQTRDDLEGRSGMFDTFSVVNSTNAVVATYPFGQPIAGLGNALDGKTVVQANPWEQYVYLSNLSLDGNYVYPLPWSCDDKKFYVGTFSEAELGFKMYDCWDAQQQGVSSTTNYLLMFDDTCDGVSQITKAKFDDDPVIDDNWAYDGSNWRAYDYHHFEEGAVNLCEGGQQGGNSSEKWIDLGRDSWPFSITDYSDVASGNLDIFKSKWSVNMGEDVSLLSLWVQTKNFDGTTFNGTITLEKATGTSWQCGMMTETTINLTVYDGNMVDGIGYLDVNLSNLTTSQPNLKFKVEDSSNADKYEYVVKNFYYGPADSNMMNNGPGQGQDCGDMFKSGPGGYGGGSDGDSMGGGGDMEGQAEFERCNSNEDNSSCESANCVWIPLSFFGPQAPPEDKCLPCMAMDDQQTKCETYSSICMWIPAGTGGMGGTGVCDPLTGGGGPGGGGGEPSCSEPGMIVGETKEVLTSCSCGGNVADVGEYCCPGGIVQPGLCEM